MQLKKRGCCSGNECIRAVGRVNFWERVSWPSFAGRERGLGAEGRQVVRRLLEAGGPLVVPQIHSLRSATRRGQLATLLLSI